jgi:hypothetical protein
MMHVLVPEDYRADRRQRLTDLQARRTKVQTATPAYTPSSLKADCAIRVSNGDEGSSMGVLAFQRRPTARHTCYLCKRRDL